jgi:hypothetical protein
MASKEAVDYRHTHLQEDIAELREVMSGENMISYLNGPDGMIIECTQSNAWAIYNLMGHAFAERYPDIFTEFDPESTPMPTQSELLDSTGGPFGSINDLEMQ